MTLKVVTMDSSISTVIDNEIAAWKDQGGPLLPILHGVQDKLGHIPEAAIPDIARALNLSRAEVHGVVTFYHHFRQAPGGRHTLRVCRAESCQSAGGEAVEEAAKLLLGVDWHQTTADGDFTLEPVYCLGHCACSPAVMVGDEVHARVTPQSLRQLLGEYRGSRE